MFPLTILSTTFSNSKHLYLRRSLYIGQSYCIQSSDISLIINTEKKTYVVKTLGLHLLSSFHVSLKMASNKKSNLLKILFRLLGSSIF